MKKANNFQIAKVQPQGVVANSCLIFYQFRLGVAYKSVAYKKSVYFRERRQEKLRLQNRYF